MHATPDHQASTSAGPRGRTPASWRAAAAVTAAAALSLAVGTLPAAAAGGYTVTATIGVGSHPDAVAVDPDTHTAYVANYSDNTGGDGTVSVISAARTLTALTASIGLSPRHALTLTATLTAGGRPLGGQPISFITGRTRLCTPSWAPKFPGDCGDVVFSAGLDTPSSP
ncbi:MAG: hypothetical protein ABSB76_21240 [Streptosporangiaceae bacterium]|jgi:DNA-binding beta-propeller fold protein YncE